MTTNAQTQNLNDLLNLATETVDGYSPEYKYAYELGKRTLNKRCSICNAKVNTVLDAQSLEEVGRCFYCEEKMYDYMQDARGELADQAAEYDMDVDEYLDMI